MADTTSLRTDLDALLHPAQVAAVFGVSPKTVSRWSDAGRLASVRTKGGHRRFPARAVLALLEEAHGVGEPCGTAGSLAP
jgi:excisionase family DNA binding protein